LERQTAAQRAEVITQFIRIAHVSQLRFLKKEISNMVTNNYSFQIDSLQKECKKAKNFNTCFAIVCGLQHGSVSRLKISWEVSESFSNREKKTDIFGSLLFGFQHEEFL
jgi:hypothetical protein